MRSWDLRTRSSSQSDCLDHFSLWRFWIIVLDQSEYRICPGPIGNLTLFYQQRLWLELFTSYLSIMFFWLNFESLRNPKNYVTSTKFDRKLVTKATWDRVGINLCPAVISLDDFIFSIFPYLRNVKLFNLNMPFQNGHNLGFPL